MDLRVDGAGEHQRSAEIVPLAGGRGRSAAETLDQAVANGHPAAFGDA
jgi:hypothetical protein